MKKAQGGEFAFGLTGYLSAAGFLPQIPQICAD